MELAGVLVSAEAFDILKNELVIKLNEDRKAIRDKVKIIRAWKLFYHPIRDLVDFLLQIHDYLAYVYFTKFKINLKY